MIRNVRSSLSSMGALFGTVGTAAMIVAASCSSPPVEIPTITPFEASPVNVNQNPMNKVDVLFLVDNSPSMAPMQSQLVGKFGSFLQVFQDLANKGTYADLHIGVVTSDYGAGMFDGTLGTDTGSGLMSGCMPSPGPGTAQNDPTGQGLLQAKGYQAASSCVPPTGSVPYIQYVYGPNGPTTSNLPTGQDLATTFTCMASVGSLGCGFEHQLEAVYAALKASSDTTSINHGFVRPDALLTVVFVTNEDDGSVPPTSKVYQKADVTIPFDTYRQTHYGVACGNPSALTPYTAVGALSNCEPAPMLGPSAIGQEYDVSRYINFFTQPAVNGGIKADPTQVILVGIDATEKSVEIDAVGQACGSQNYTPGTTSVCLKHSCQNTSTNADSSSNTVFFGDPAVRLNNVINANMIHAISSICGDDETKPPDYSTALANLANLITSNIGNGCIKDPLVGGIANAECSVEDITSTATSTSVSQIPRCATTSPTYPCWQIDAKASCAPPASACGVGLTVNRGGVAAPPNTVAHVSCATIPQPSTDGGTATPVCN